MIFVQLIISFFRDAPHPKKSVVFADGIHPGEGTSASENEEGQSDNTAGAPGASKSAKKKRIKKKLLSRSKHSKRNKTSIKNSIAVSQQNLALLTNKENFMEMMDKQVCITYIFVTCLLVNN